MRIRPRPTRSAAAALVTTVLVASCQANGDDLTVTDSIDEPDAEQSAATSDAATPAATAPPATDSTAATTDSSVAEDPDPSSDDPTGDVGEGSAGSTPATSVPMPSASDLVEPTTPDKASAAPTSPVGFDDTVYERGLIDRGLAPFVTRATTDLASRLAIDAGDIEVLTAVLVVWPNSALGCPEPGMSYAQVTTDGSVIELGVEGRVYRYHSGGSTGPSLCDRSLDQPPQPTALS